MIDKTALLGQRQDTDRVVALPGLGPDAAVKVRGLTRTEALRVQGVGLSEAEAERKLLALAVLEPVLTEEDVARWQRVAPAGELQPVVSAILELSGMTAVAVKDAAAQFPE